MDKISNNGLHIVGTGLFSVLYTENGEENPAYSDIQAQSTLFDNYIQKSGKVYYMGSFAPITRTEDSREQIKIIIEF
jgi:hypothetical protein